MPPSEQRPQAADGFAPLGVHLVGSVPLATAARCSRCSGMGSATGCGASPTARRGRARTGSSGSTRCSAPGGSSRSCRRSRLVPGAAAPAPAPHEDGPDLAFEQLGYADAAAASFRGFARLKRDGGVPRGCRFQVSPADAAGAHQRVRGARRPGAARAGVRARDARAGARSWPSSRTTSSRCSGTRTSSSGCSRARSPRGSRTSRAASSSGCSGSVAARPARRRARLPLLLGTTRPAPRTSSRPTRAGWSRSPTRSRRAWTGL